MLRCLTIIVSILPLHTSTSWSQTSGPGTPEVHKFTPAGIDNLVNLFSGDFSYNIPLLELDGGYPINLSYSSGANMMEEAGPVGLGWQLNIGRITRTVRGLPDDFNGDKLVKTVKQKTEINIGLGIRSSFEIFGLKDSNLKSGISFSNFRGVDLESDLTASLPKDYLLSGGLSLGLGTNEAASIKGSSSIGYKGYRFGVSTSFNSIEGLKDVNLNLSYYNKETQESTFLGGFPLSSAKIPFTPKIDITPYASSGQFSYKLTKAFFGLAAGKKIYGQFSTSSYDDHPKSFRSYGHLYLQNAGDYEAVMDVATEKESPVHVEDPNLFLAYQATDVYNASAHGLSANFKPFRTDIGVSHHPNQASISGRSASLGIETGAGGYLHLGFDASYIETSSYSGQLRGTNDRPFTNSTIYFKNIGELTAQVNQSVMNGYEPEMDKSLTKTKVPEPRNTLLQHFTFSDLSNPPDHLKKYFRNDTNRRGHHIAMFRVTKDDGTIYEFGLAAYNTVHEDYTFSTEGPQNSNLLTIRQIRFDATDITTGNNKGQSNYFSKAETPPYAYAYFLTAVYTPDYIDITGDGPSSDDFGSYTLFDYQLLHSDFGWRTPTNENMANFIPGNLADPQDDMASFTYGEKEIWQLTDISTKNFKVRLSYSKRADGSSNKNAKGEIKQLERLDTIKYYSNIDWIKDSIQAIPIKTIHFSYDYSLCQNIPVNPGGGKLTLKKLSFQFGESKKGLHSYYAFQYHDTTYNEKNLDRWGNLKIGDKRIKNDLGGRFAYSEQVATKANQEAQGWNLKQISLPEGGRIKIEYEANDYAFVQNKPALMMCPIVGTVADPTSAAFNNQLSANSFLVIKVTEKVKDDNDAHKYIEQLDNSLYVNALVEVGENANEFGYEEVSGYYTLESCMKGSMDSTIVIKLKPSGDQKPINPITRALWRKMMKTMRHMVYPPIIDANNSILSNVGMLVPRLSNTMGKLASDFRSIESLMNGRGTRMYNQGPGFIRLRVVNGSKKGGGTRVKRITINDNWSVTQNENSIYGKEYEYRTINSEGRYISSGVASYEPIGNEENPFVQPTLDLKTSNGLPSDLYYNKTEPFGEAFFPGPSVGYSFVTVRDVKPNNLSRVHAKGYEQHVFYTTKDFPTITKRTAKEQNYSPGKQTSLYVAQGFYAEINDMNGKPRTIRSFDEYNAKTPISETEYRYRQNKDGTLNNLALSINPKTGAIDSTVNLGVDFEYTYFTSETETQTASFIPPLNVDVIPIFGVSIPIPTAFFHDWQTGQNFKARTTTKVVYRTGILDSVISRDNGAVVRTKNVLFDQLTGRVIVSAAENEFHEPVFTTVLPAYWFHEGMGPGFHEQDLSFKTFKPENFLDGAHFFNCTADQATEAWVYDKKLINNRGDEFLNYGQLKLFRSGARNQQSVTELEIRTKANPVQKDKPNILTFEKVISSSATHYSDQWQTYYAVKPRMKINVCDNCNRNQKLVKRLDKKCFTFTTSVKDTLQSNDPLFSYLHEQIVVTEGDETFLITLNKKFLKCIVGWTKELGEGKSIKFCLSQPKAIDSICGESHRFEVKIKASRTYNNDSNEICVSYSKDPHFGITTIQPTSVCSSRSVDGPEPHLCVSKEKEVINPFVSGLLGTWRPASSSLYLTDRVYDDRGVNHQGLFDGFDIPYPVSKKCGIKFSNAVSSEKWVFQDSSMIFDPHGQPLQQMNVIKMPRATIYGYGYNLPVATGQNIAYTDLAFDNFEDYHFKNQRITSSSACPIEPHFKVARDKAMLDSSVWHTGSYSLKVKVGSTYSYSVNINSVKCVPSKIVSNRTYPYKTTFCDLVSKFAPQKEQAYKINVWIKEQIDLTNLEKTDGEVIVYFRDKNGVTLPNSRILLSSGPIVNDWRLVTATFTVDAAAEEFVLDFVSSNNRDLWIDDVRIEQLDAAVKSYVYDPISLKLVATFDENHFALIYEYDLEGRLIRTKKETERGLVTLQEIHTVRPKQK